MKFINIIAGLISKFVRARTLDLSVTDSMYKGSVFTIRQQAPGGRSALALAVKAGADRSKLGWVWWTGPDNIRHWVGTVDKTQKIICLVNNHHLLGELTNLLAGQGYAVVAGQPRFVNGKLIYKEK